MFNEPVRDPTWCSTCYGAAKKAGRPVRLTELYKWPICAVCESRMRNGLIHYVPGTGTELLMFFERCDDCRHVTDDGCSGRCAHGIGDKVTKMMWEPSDSASAWHDPADMDASTSPAKCLRFTDKDDRNGAVRDPPPKDCIGQLTFGELLAPAEASHAERTGKAVPSCPE